MSDPDAPLRDALWKMYQEQQTHVRHYETQRSTVAGTFIAIAAALVGLVTFDKSLNSSDLPLTLFLLFLGIFGAVFAFKQYERASRYAGHAGYYRDEIDKLLPDSPLKRIRDEAEDKHKQKFPSADRFRIHNFWIGIYVLIAILGLVLSIQAWKFPWTVP